MEIPQTENYGAALAQWVRAWAKARGFTPTKVLTDAHVGPGRLREWERGSKPERATVVKLADALGEDRNVLLRLAGHQPDQEVSGLTREEVAVLRWWRAVPLGERPLLLGLLALHAGQGALTGQALEEAVDRVTHREGQPA